MLILMVLVCLYPLELLVHLSLRHYNILEIHFQCSDTALKFLQSSNSVFYQKVILNHLEVKSRMSAQLDVSLKSLDLNLRWIERNHHAIDKQVSSFL